MAKISVVINTRNEEENLPRALASIKKLADEVIVVDMESVDSTKKIAKKFGAKVYDHKLTNYVEPARNYAIDKATGDWIFILDADEEVPGTLVSKLRRLSKNETIDFFRIPRRNKIFGKWIRHSRWWPDYNIRFFKKDSVVWGNIIHSVPTTKGDGFDIEAKKEFAITHHHYQSVEQYIDRMNRYTTQHALLKIEDNYKFSWRDVVKRPVGEFLSRYFFGKGYKDGLHGLALSGLQGFSELVMYLKIWQFEGFKKQQLDLTKVVAEMRKTDSEKRYWQADAMAKETRSVVEIVKRKFRLP